VGPNGETLLDYAAFDAHRGGFERVVIVVRHETLPAFHPVANRFRGPLEVRLAVQHLEDAPKGANLRGRAKPWGTGHAVLVAAPHVSGSFAVCNADDFYGAGAFAAAVPFLQGRDVARGRWALVGYPLEATLSPHGPVNRAVCRLDEQGWLVDLEERSVAAVNGDRGALVSMNFWCFTQHVFDHLSDGFGTFAAAAGPDEEYLLPDAVGEAVRSGAVKVRVLPAGNLWLGLTHPEDRELAAARLRVLHAAGDYPARLWR
jgi:UTP-glucose-1-phosphate uridylyltransferase